MYDPSDFGAYAQYNNLRHLMLIPHVIYLCLVDATMGTTRK